MNQRIQELAEQAYDLCSKRTYGSIHSSEEYNRIFANLILEECIKICEEGDKTQMTSKGAADRISLLFS